MRNDFSSQSEATSLFFSPGIHMNHNADTCDTCKQNLPRRLDPYRDPLCLNTGEVKKEEAPKKEVGAADQAINKAADKVELWLNKPKEPKPYRSPWKYRHPQLAKVGKVIVWALDKKLLFGLDKTFDAIAWMLRKTGLAFCLKHFGKALWWILKNTLGRSFRALGKGINTVRWSIQDRWKTEYTQTISQHLDAYYRYYLGGIFAFVSSSFFAAGAVIPGILVAYYFFVVPTVYSLVNKASLKQLPPKEGE